MKNTQSTRIRKHSASRVVGALHNLWQEQQYLQEQLVLMNRPWEGRELPRR